jgi:hypothetical protein
MSCLVRRQGELTDSRPAYPIHAVPAHADSLCITLKHTAMTTYTHSDLDARRNPAEPFEWEELPSLSNVLLRRHVPAGSYSLAAEMVAEAQSRLRSEPSFAPAWIETRPADLDSPIPSAPLRETTLGGLDAREIVEPDLFRHFFGASAA